MDDNYECGHGVARKDWCGSCWIRSKGPTPTDPGEKVRESDVKMSSREIKADAKALLHDTFSQAAPTKDTNPKDSIGSRKAGISTIPGQVMAELGLSMLEGACKYGRYNYRVSGVRSSVYYDAAFRHLAAWWEGEDIDPDSGLSHLVKAMACLAVLRDAQIQGMLNDDRPPASKAGWVAEMNKKAAEILDRYPEPKAPFTAKDGK